VYWTYFAIFVAAALGVTALMYLTPKKQRVFHYLTLATLLVASISSFTVASNLGSAPIQVEFRGGVPFLRQIFYVRFIDWFVTTPLILVEILLLSGIEWDSTLFAVVAAETSVVSGLAGSLTASVYKWGYFVLAIGCLAYVIFQLAFAGRNAASHLAADSEKFYNIVAFYFIGVSLLYPLWWGLSEGGNVIGADGEAVWAGINDLLVKVVGGALIIFGISRYPVDFERLGFVRAASEKESHPRNTEETAREAQV